MIKNSAHPSQASYSQPLLFDEGFTSEKQLSEFEKRNLILKRLTSIGYKYNTSLGNTLYVFALNNLHHFDSSCVKMGNAELVQIDVELTYDAPDDFWCTCSNERNEDFLDDVLKISENLYNFLSFDEELLQKNYNLNTFFDVFNRLNEIEKSLTVFERSFLLDENSLFEEKLKKVKVLLVRYKVEILKTLSSEEILFWVKLNLPIETSLLTDSEIEGFKPHVLLLVNVELSVIKTESKELIFLYELFSVDHNVFILPAWALHLLKSRDDYFLSLTFPVEKTSSDITETFKILAAEAFESVLWRSKAYASDFEEGLLKQLVSLYETASILENSN